MAYLLTYFVILSCLLACRRLLRVRDDYVYDIGHHDCHCTQLSSSITEHVRHAAMGQYCHCLYCESKKGATLSMAITLSVLHRFAKFFHCCKEQEISNTIHIRLPTKP